ncbi:hypothetical protein QLX67_11060, partial [Balneolaceae bacterium ANBcel3]|nr:hypothetical protein [Balneolaceae bacterium ANBcel3]
MRALKQIACTVTGLVWLSLFWGYTAHGSDRNLTGFPADDRHRYEMVQQLEQQFGHPESHSSMEEPASVRCLTPYFHMYEQVKNEVSPAVRSKMESSLHREQEAGLEAYYSESGRFRILYRTSGSNAVPETYELGMDVPDYVYWTAYYADSTYRYQVETLGFVDPTVMRGDQDCRQSLGSATGDSLITIEYHNDSGVYGWFDPVSPLQIFVHHTFEGFPDYGLEDNALAALKVTIAHEFKHVVQYASNCFRGSAGHYSILEMDATMMENIVFPEVNDYLNYINNSREPSLFHRPEYSIPA